MSRYDDSFKKYKEFALVLVQNINIVKGNQNGKETYQKDSLKINNYKCKKYTFFVSFLSEFILL